MRYCSLRILIQVGVVAGTLLVAAGCQSEKGPTPKEQATKHWNSARSGVLASLARDQYQAGNFDKCRQTVDEAIKLTPENPPLHVLSARLYVEQGKLELAENELKAARQYAPNDGEAYYLSGVVYQRWQKPQAALDFYKTASEKSPAELAYVLAWSEMLVLLDRVPDALELLEGKVTYFEHSGTIRDAAGQLLQQLGRIPEAVAMFRQASILSEDDLAVRERLALAFYSNRDYRGCADIITRLVQDPAHAKRADLFTVLGECQLQTNQARAARFSFETATQLDPSNVPGWRGLGRAALETGDWKRAELALSKAMKLDAAQGETHLLLGYVYLKQEKLPEALASFQQACTLDRGDTVGLCMIGVVLEKMGHSDSATDYYGRALQIKPGDDFATHLMAGVNPHD